MRHYKSSNSKSTIIQMKSLYMYCTLYVPHGAEKDIMVTLYIVYQYRCTEMMLLFHSFSHYIVVVQKEN